jgi:hypothetical protein
MGTLSGWDRVRFRGTLRRISSLGGMISFLGHRSILLKEFKGWAQSLTNQLRECASQLAEAHEQPIHYVNNSASRKEELAQAYAGKRWNEVGLSCILTALEPCYSFEVGPNREKKRLELRLLSKKCLHYYFYLRHPAWGPMHVRLQSWLPFNVHVCINGREWLASELTRLGVPHRKCDNTFRFVEDMALAQQLLDNQLSTDWSRELEAVLREVHPSHEWLFGDYPLSRYWSAEETEWATDVLFRSARDLERLYPRLVEHAMLRFGSEDVLRFLGRPGSVSQQYQAQVQSDLKARHEGVRIKHAINQNSVKMYDKQSSVLRVETTINNPRDMQAYRPAEGSTTAKRGWRRLRKGVSDLHRRAEISHASNARYLESLATVETDSTLQEATQHLCQRVVSKTVGRARAINPLSAADRALLTAVNRGEFAINGFRNRDLLPLLYAKRPSDAAGVKRLAAKVTRQIRLLRAHGVIKKIPKTHRYELTAAGRTTINAVLTASNTQISKLTQLAA